MSRSVSSELTDEGAATIRSVGSARSGAHWTCHRASINQTALTDILPGQVSISELNTERVDLVPTSYEYDVQYFVLIPR
jgi:hypothetical protein